MGLVSQDWVYWATIGTTTNMWVLTFENEEERGTKWENTLFSEIKHSFALLLKLNREMPLICNSTIEKSSFNE